MSTMSTWNPNQLSLPPINPSTRASINSSPTSNWVQQQSLGQQGFNTGGYTNMSGYSVPSSAYITTAQPTPVNNWWTANRGQDYQVALASHNAPQSGSFNNNQAGLGGQGVQPTALGWNAETLQGVGSVMGGIAGLGGLYTGFEQLGLAKDQFDFTKQAYQTNLQNQTQLTNAQIMAKQREMYQSNPALYDNPDSAAWQDKNLLKTQESK